MPTFQWKFHLCPRTLFIWRHSQHYLGVEERPSPCLLIWCPIRVNGRRVASSTSVNSQASSYKRLATLVDVPEPLLRVCSRVHPTIDDQWHSRSRGFIDCSTGLFERIRRWTFIYCSLFSRLHLLSQNGRKSALVEPLTYISVAYLLADKTCSLLDWRQALNNYLQASQSSHRLSWYEPPSACSGVWTVTLLCTSSLMPLTSMCIIFTSTRFQGDRQPFKTGRGSSKGVAKEDAARQAYLHFNPHAA